MTYQVGFREPPLDLVSAWGEWGIWTSGFTVPASGAWESANRTIYLPIYVPVTVPVKRFWWVNGATVTGGATITGALYNDTGAFAPGKRVDSAGAVQGTLNQVQFVNATAGIVIRPNLYWLALASTSATNTTLFRVGAGNLGVVLKFQEATGTPPATATPVAGNGDIWVFGFSTVASP